MEPNPPGFDPQTFIEGIHTAMNLGAPNVVDDRATFCWTETPAGTGADEAGVPFDPDNRPVRQNRRVQVPCAIQYTDGADRSERFGIVQPSSITVTLLDPDYDQVKDFDFVVWGGDKYLRRSGQPYALGSVGVWVFQCRAEDEV